VESRKLKTKPMRANLKILKRKDGSFQGDSGEPVSYFWYKAERLSDGMTIEFGSREGGHEEGTEIETELEKFERPGGRIGYKEIL
jgi:hypothetical protein